MLSLLYGHDQDIAEWTAGRLGQTVDPPYRAIGIVDETGEIRGGMVFNRYTRANIEITMYGPGCLTRAVIRGWFDYVFEQLKCIRLTAITRRDNKLVCRLLPRLGFTYEATMKNFFGPKKADDAIVFRLTHEFASRWM